MVEVIRKIWNCLVLRRIGGCLERYGMLRDSQNAYRSGRGTDSASIQFINAIEEAEELSTEMFVSSWDTKRAFDSPSKDALVHSWERLGVPARIAEYLVDMDKDGFTIVKTGLAYARVEDEGWEPLVADGVHHFVAERGTGQGDVVSPLNWDCFFDILLSALEDGSDGDYYVRTNDEGLRVANDLSYSDDLVSMSATVEGLQRKADIVCAFMSIFQMTIVVPKLRMVWFDFRRESHEGLAPYIVIHDSGWNGIDVPLRRNGEMKYLGTVYGGDHRYMTQFRATLADARRMVAVVLSKKASAGLKKAALQMCVMSKACYVAKFATWTRAQMREIEGVFSGAFRRISKNMRSYPTRMLYMTTKDGGLGFQSFTDRVMAERWGVLTRALSNPGAARTAAQGLIERVVREGGGCTIRGFREELHPTIGGKFGCPSSVTICQREG